VKGEICSSTAADPGRLRDQAARIVSLDQDARGYAELGERDEVIATRQRESGWLRPVLFHSPYEAACWAVLSARIRQSQAAHVRDELSAAHGAEIAVDGEELPGFPAPVVVLVDLGALVARTDVLVRERVEVEVRLLAVGGALGLSDEKLRRLHGVAEVALEGRLDRERLQRLPQDEALAELREIRGIGPFWSEGILLRAVGTTDALAPGREARAPRRGRGLRGTRGRRRRGVPRPGRALAAVSHLGRGPAASDGLSARSRRAGP
jgi:DNA-3-methyladenine glycosylase II